MLVLIMTTYIKEQVSKQKRRFVQDGFNLDLTYISDKVIAMGFPASNYEAIYRNSMDEVRRLLEQKHKDHYKLYNLCSERSYDPKNFQGRVAFYPFDDHNPPEFGMMEPFCEDVDKWLKERDGNIAVVHCKAGKGRTGLMICAYLLHCRQSQTAEEVLNFYASKRTHDDKGVTIPSQRRYVDYYAAMVSEKLLYNPVKLYLYSFVIDPLPALGLGQQEGYIQFEVRQTRIRPYESKVYQVKRTDGRINIVLPQPLLIVGDVKIEFHTRLDVFSIGKSLGKNPKFLTQTKLFHFWINTFFIDLERSSPLTHESLSSRPSLPVKTVPASEVTDGDRNCRSNHNSGGTEAGGQVLPPPRQLRGSQGDAATSSSSGEIYQETRTPNGSCLASVQTIHSHPPARTVSIVEPIKQRIETDCDELEVRLMSISDDTLAEKGATETTHSSFNTNRRRHTSVPMTSKTGSGNQNTRFTRQIPGKLMSVRLKKNQIDKADKDKSSKFSDNFNVTLFLVRPNDQTLKDEFNRPNTFCQHVDDGNNVDGEGGGVDYWSDKSGDFWGEKGSSDEDLQNQEATSLPGEVFHPSGEVFHPGGEEFHHDSDENSRNLAQVSSSVDLAPSRFEKTKVVSGMVRNATEPGRPLGPPLSTHSTWI